MTATLRIRSFEDRDQVGVLELLREALGETDVLRRTPELFAWKHLHNPFGRSIMLVAEDGEGIVGFRAFMRWELTTPAGDTVHCVRPVDTATHPRARRRGIFRSLTEAAIEVSREEGVNLVFNTPNPRSGAGYLSMGWTRVGPIGVMVRPSRGLMRKTSRPPSVDGSVPWDGQEVNNRPPKALRTRRTPEYLHWRFGSHPTARYGVVDDGSEAQVVVRPSLRKGRPELVVSEMFGSRGQVAVRKAARLTDAAYLVGWFSPGSDERAAALRAGMIPVPKVKALTLFARPLSDAPDVGRLSSWDLSLGDLELL